jgi:hypothetical protein
MLNRMDDAALIRVMQNREFWRRCFGSAYLFGPEKTPEDNKPRQRLPRYKTDLDDKLEAIQKARKAALKELSFKPLYPANWVVNKEGKWELTFYETPLED